MSAEIKKEVTELAGLIKKDITLDAKTGVATIAENVYEKNLPEGTTKATVESIQQYNTLLAAAATLALGELSIPAMKKNKSLDEVKLEVPMVGKDCLKVTFDRSRQVNILDGKGVSGTQTKYGAASVKFEMYGTGPRGELKKVKAILAEQAAAAFGG